MKLEDQVCSLELAKRLKELGVKKESLLYHFNEPFNDSDRNWIEDDWIINFKNEIPLTVKREEIYSAFTVTELGEMLPSGKLAASSKDESGWYMQVIAPIEKWKEMYPCKNEADARAKMLIHLIEQGIVKI